MNGNQTRRFTERFSRRRTENKTKTQSTAMRSASARLTLWLAVPLLAILLILYAVPFVYYWENMARPGEAVPFSGESGLPYHAGQAMDRLLYNQFPTRFDSDSLAVRIATDNSGNIVFRDHLGLALIEKQYPSSNFLRNSGYIYGDTIRFLVLDEFSIGDLSEIGRIAGSMPDRLQVVGRDEGFYFYAHSLSVEFGQGEYSDAWAAPEHLGSDRLTIVGDENYLLRANFPPQEDFGVPKWERWTRLQSILQSIPDTAVTRREEAFARADCASLFGPFFWQEITTESYYPELFTNTGLRFYTRFYEAPFSDMLLDCRVYFLILPTIAAVLLLYVHFLAERLLAAPLRRCIAEAAHIVGAESVFPAEDAKRRDEIGALIQTLKQTEAAFQEKWDTERALERKRQDFVAAASHDLKTPLALIGGYAEAVQQEIDPAENARYLDSIEREAEKMNRLVLGMLDYTRLERMEGLEHGRRENLPELLNGWLDEAEPLFEGRTLERSLPDRLFARCDATLFRRAVDNLLSNAAKFTPEGGAVRVALTARQSGSSAEPIGNRIFALTVENDGEPIPEGELERIFEMFYRADQARTRGGGNGVGLASAKRICELHGFTLRAENTRSGVKFTIEG